MSRQSHSSGSENSGGRYSRQTGSRRASPQATLIHVEPVVMENDDRPLQPRKKRGRNRRRADRGLPDRAVLKALYLAYREKADRLWPELVGTELLPELSEEVIENAIDQYERQHRDGQIDTKNLEEMLAVHGVKRVAMFYGRYSCDQSQTTSVEDQLALSLELARREGYFIPFPLVFGDFALSGLTDDRPGFDGIRNAIRNAGPGITLIYIAEFHRASRNYRDWEDLYFLVRRSRRVLKSANGDFDSSRADAPAVLAQASATNVAEKMRRLATIKRGRGGSLGRGTSLGHPPIGCTRRQAFDPKTKTLRERRNGRMITEWVIDPITKAIVEWIFELFVVHRWSRRRIAKHFNELKVDDSESWSAGRIKDILRNTTYVGVLIRNRYTQVRDPETGKRELIENPHSEWIIVFMPHLRFIPPMIFKQAWRRLAEAERASSLTGKKQTRMERNPSTPYDGLLSMVAASHVR
jgi:DNA invertase Pin-like site-specific DNA recombinase